ncbi:2Fe-2S iron-sulfur cluster-binding protein [Rhizobium terrae]|uniref:2Fe-2S iron-sulfur cluster-binding protein n=1 Tax=Rhizobium terrae TaxID=2171756 RepID=UPI000E3CC744|nr:2Fe-2S iron-sulfur cluster-binding protein [Rhizobium terrae]
MNVNVQIDPAYPASDIARVAFSMFVHIADFDKNITAQDVRRFQAILRDNAWADNDFRNCLRVLQQDYSTFWTSYEDGVLLVDADSIATELNRIQCGIEAEAASKLRLSLARFIEKLDGSAYGVKVMQGDQRGRLQARKELVAILDEAGKQSARPAPALMDMPSVFPVLHVPSVPDPPAIADLWPAATISPGQAPVWGGGKTKVRCVSVAWETQDTKTYSFVADPQVLFHYKPGQFITIEIPLGGNVLRRSYTISSSPSRPYTLSITVKKVPMGWVSNWLFDNMVEGFECAVTGPAGKFTCHDHPSSKLLFLAAGSGITPLMSMLRWLADTCSATDIVFINNVRTPDDIIFHQELLHMSTRLAGKMRLAIVPSSVSPSRPWHGPVGSVSENLIQTYAPDFIERETFVCGPPGYMAAVKSMLAGMGLPMSQYHDESFGGASAAASPAASTPSPPAPLVATQSAFRDQPGRLGSAPSLLSFKNAVIATGTASTNAPTSRQLNLAQQPPRSGSCPADPAASRAAPARSPSGPLDTTRTANVSIQGSNDRFLVRSGQTILEAADAAGVSLAHSCRAGVCGACKIRKMSGRVEMAEQGILSQADMDAGFVLTCIGRPIGDVILAL